MNGLEGTRMDLYVWAAKFFGSVIGMLISMVMVAPAPRRTGFIASCSRRLRASSFAPSMQGLVRFLQGSTLEHHMAAACAAGFTCGFILEFVARMVSKEDTLRRLLEEVLCLSGKGGAPKP